MKKYFKCLVFLFIFSLFISNVDALNRVDITEDIGEPVFEINLDYNGGSYEGKGYEIFHWVGFAFNGTKDVFMEGVTAPEGRELVAIEVNGERKEFDFIVEVNKDYTFKYIWSGNSTINTINLTGILNPLAGKTATTSSIKTTTSGLKFNSVEWIDEAAGKTLKSTDKFVAKKKYVLRIVISAEDGYELAESATLNPNVKPLMDDYNKQTEEIRLYYEAKVSKSVKVTLNPNGGKVKTKSKKVKTYNKYGTLPAPTRKGYKFVGWTTKKNGSTFVKSSSLVTNQKNHTLYAKWEAIKYKINYVLNGGTNNTKNPSTYTVAKAVTLANPTKKGYTFNGWFSDKKFKKKMSVIKKGSTGNKTVYAKWTKTKYKITYVLNGGKNSSINRTTYTVTDKVYLYDPSRSGYIFSGWYSDSSFTNLVSSIEKGTAKNIKLYARWLEKTSKNLALKRATDYLSSMYFSYEGLIGQLEFEGFSHEDAVYAVDNCGANWDEQAKLHAKSYLETSAFSYEGLIGQLEFEKYTHEQAVNAVNNCGADWNYQAVRCAKEYLDSSAFSYDGLISQLEFEGFTHEQAVYGADNCGVAW